MKKPFQKQPEIVDRVVYVTEQQPAPCKSDQCKPDYVEERPCKSDKCKPCKSNRCNKCRKECNDNEQCQSECVYVEKCRYDLM